MVKSVNPETIPFGNVAPPADSCKAPLLTPVVVEKVPNEEPN